MLSSDFLLVWKFCSFYFDVVSLPPRFRGQIVLLRWCLPFFYLSFSSEYISLSKKAPSKKKFSLK